MSSSVDTAVAKFDAMPPDEQKLAAQALRAEALKRCSTDPLFYLGFVNTRDEADAEHSVKPFPVHLEYIRELVSEWHRNQKSATVKSRQLIVSWSLAAYMTWWARFKPNQYVAYQTQVWEDATKMVCMAGGDKDATFLGRMQFIERNLPGWLKQTIKENEGTIAYPNGSMIEALPGGSNKIRGKVPSLYGGDEFAFQEEAKGVWTSLAPLVQKGSKVILVSTPNGADGNMFFHLWHGTQYKNPTSG